MRRRRESSRKRARRILTLAGPMVTWAMRRSAGRFMRETARFRDISENMLARILEQNGRTAFGRDRGLDGPNARQVFEALPTTTYTDYLPYIERIAAGEQNVLTAEPVIYFSTTSGTTGPPKMIPVTQSKLDLSVSSRVTCMGLALRAGVLKSMRGPFMTIMTEHLGGRTSGGVQKGAATTSGFRQLGSISEVIQSSPTEVTQIPDQAAARYLHLLFGLGQPHLWTIMAFFPATILFAMRDLHEHAERLLRDLADGTIDPELALTADVHARLERRLRANPARARALGKLLAQDRFTVSNIWPDIGSILTATGGAFHFYVNQLEPFLGDVAMFSPLYSASEGTFGVGFSADRPHYLLTPLMSYIELLPTESMDDPAAKPIPAWKAEPGRSYEVVITTLDGLVRYRLHDIVTVVDFCGQTPVIEFVERRGQVVDIVGEKTAEHHVVEAIDAASHLVDEPLVDYVLAPDTGTTPACYLLAIEEWHGDCEHNLKAREFVRAVDAALRRIAPDYDEECELGTLGPMELVVLRPGAFARLRERQTAAGVTDSQIKTPHVVADPTFIEREFGAEIQSRGGGRDA